MTLQLELAPPTTAPPTEHLTHPAAKDTAEQWAERWRARGIDVELRPAGRGWVLVEADDA